MNKEYLRKFILNKRLNANYDLLSNHSYKICNLLLKLCYGLKNIYLYHSFRSEVNLSTLGLKLLENNKNIFLPKVIDNKLRFAKIKDYNQSLEKGYNGIMEPIIDSEGNTLETPDLILVPGVVFDKSCRRVGYGKGFYDKYLSKMQQSIIIGVAYDFQIVEKIKTDEHDVKMDKVVTEKFVYTIK